MTRPEATSRPPARRAVLLGGLGTVAALLAGGCTRDGSPGSAGSRVPAADLAAARRAAATTQGLLSGEAALATQVPAVGTLVKALAAHHQAHLQALTAIDPTLAPSAAAAATSAPTTSATDSPARSSATSGGAGTATASAGAGAAGAAVRAETHAAVEALTDLETTSADLAIVLARIAASRAVHADLLAEAGGAPAPAEDLGGATTPAASGTSAPATSPAGTAAAGPSGAGTGAATTGASPRPPTGTVIDVDVEAAAALSEVVAGEHAAVFAYGMITARLTATGRSHAQYLWRLHRQHRDGLERQLLDSGFTPPAALAAYDLGAVPTTTADVVALAVRVEDGLAAVAAEAVGTAEGPIRGQIAATVVRAARQSTSWSGSSTALPGSA